jgi:hypothetical protein
VTVLPGANCHPTNCITITASNLVAYTCSNCVTVPFSATAVDTCCPGTVPTLVYSLPATYCFPNNSTTPVQVIANDQCGNAATNIFTVTVLPLANCPSNCITITASNIVAYTCSNCVAVPFSATAVDTCCPAGSVNLVYSLPATYCFPLNSTTPVQVIANDQCGNAATNTFTVTVLPLANCPSNCITITASNLVAYTCSNCVTVPFSATAVDTCCPGAAPTLVYSLPATYCFPQNSTTPVQVIAHDQCGNAATNTFTVTVLPLANCPSNCITITASNLVAYTCNNCVTVPFSATAVDTCCPLGVPTLVYSLPATYCFPLNSTTPVQVIANDQCGNAATNTFTVTVLPLANCPTNCITITASNVVVYTCDPCTPVPFTATAVDTCCPAGVPTLVYDVPAGYCFPLNSFSTVHAMASDQCGNSATKSFTVTVLPLPNCAGAPGLTITAGPGNGLMISWPGTNANLLQSKDLIHWTPIPGVTNPPYLVPTGSPMGFYRLQYN